MVRVTDHALDRFRQRAAAYGDATVKDLLEAYEQSKPCDVVPFAAVGGISYRHHADGYYFVVERRSRTQETIVSVLVPRESQRT